MTGGEKSSRSAARCAGVSSDSFRFLGSALPRCVRSTHGLCSLRGALRGVGQRQPRGRRGAAPVPRRAAVAAPVGGREGRGGPAQVRQGAAPGVRVLGRPRRARGGRPAQRAARQAPGHAVHRRPRAGPVPHARRRPAVLGLRAADRRVPDGALHARLRPRGDPPRRVPRRLLHQRLRRHLAEPVPPLLLGPVLVAGERRRLPRPPASGSRIVTDGPLIVQSDKTLLLEIDHEQSGECRKAIAPFAELERSPEHVHTYRLTPLGLWNARAAGHDAEQVIDTLLTYSRYAVPHALLVDVAETMARYGRLRLDKHPTHGLVLTSTDRPVLEEVLRAKKIKPMIGERLDDETVVVHPSERGNLKQALLKIGWPAEDYAGYVDGEAHPIELAEDGWSLRSYQQEAAESFWHGGSRGGGPPRRARRGGLGPAPEAAGGGGSLRARGVGGARAPLGGGKARGGRRGEGRGKRHPAIPGHHPPPRPPVEGRAGAPYVPDRG